QTPAASERPAVECELIAAEETRADGHLQRALGRVVGMCGVVAEGPLRERWHRLRADALTRAGEPVSAQRELERVAGSDDPSVAIAMARVTLLGGDVRAARAGLRALRPATREQEAHRLATIGWSYVL